ncbi:MAG: bglA3 [Rariglobus sp.]|jgi:beta-glucosidase|nr:bglA3 [Rariglobus sp.]
MNPNPLFPVEFTWGAASAAYQVEGFADADGRGESVWEMFCRQPGRVFENADGANAAGFYRRYPEDVRLMRELGLKGFRLSVAWPRVFPEGTGALNPPGLDFYDRLVDELLAAGIEPWVTLFHWDYPQALYHRGGWLHEDSPRWFADYVTAVVGRLSDRVTRWMTLNEPQCFIGLGHLEGVQAPGQRLGLTEALRAGHHALLAHGLGVQAIRSAAKKSAKVGCANACLGVHPASDSKADIAAARSAFAGVSAENLWNNTWWADPILLGRYPEEGLRAYGAAAPRVKPGDFETMRQPLDFFGVNLYNSKAWRAGDGGRPEPVAREVARPLTHNLWELSPEGARWMPRFLHERYGLPVVITENGVCNLDWRARDGRVRDPQRIDYTARYLEALAQAVADGVPVHGYFHWAFLDTFEWEQGYKLRMGLVHVDHADGGRRTPKESFHWYRDVIASHGATLAAGA